MGKRLERAQSKAVLSSSLAATGAAVAGPVGAGLGAVTGLIIGDRELVFPIDMIAIPAYQAYMLSGNPAFQIFIKEGEVLAQVQLTDAEEAELSVEQVLDRVNLSTTKEKPKRKKTKYQRAYKKAFDSLKPDYVKANGQWKKGGFKRCVKAAHKKAKE